MEAFIVSFFAVATAELGDKTQLVALCLASRFRRPVPIILGILAATLASQLAAGAIGQWVGVLLHGNLLHWLLALSFFAAAIWALIPDKADCEEVNRSHHGIFLTAFITFSLAEIGDKTQLATVALAAQFQSFAAVVAGTVIGMMAINIPSVFLGHAITERVSLTMVRAVSGIIFMGLGIYGLRACTFW
jgi:putative Ca2+/H+ antiporter (TMEM165/GDT1 family)